jgi:putative NIF3 family GTP cyclohydrolase 1 type 2
MFWSGLEQIRGRSYERLAALIRNGIAVYASHLPLDLHPTLGNNVLLAGALGLDASDGFARFKTVEIGVSGSCDLLTSELVQRATRFAGARAYRLINSRLGFRRRSAAGAGSDAVSAPSAASMGA